MPLNGLRHSCRRKYRGCDFVSAAAGSGKTRSDRRIIRLSREDNPLDITRILAVTFTRAAAAELRRRISQALSERLLSEPDNTRLAGQLMLLGSAKICTIDAFYNEIVKTYFQRTNLPAGYRIADDAELTLLRKSVMESLINRSFATGGAFPELADNFTSNRDDRTLLDFFIKLYEDIRKYPEGLGFLCSYVELLEKEAEAGFFHTRAGEIFAGRLREELEYYLWILNSALERFSVDAAWTAAHSKGFMADRDHILLLLGAVKARNYDAARQVALSYSPVDLSPLKAKTPAIERYRRVAQNKKQAENNRSRLFLRPDSAIPIYSEKPPRFAGLMISCQNMKKNSARKSSPAGCDFEDIRRLTLELLVDPNGRPTDIARVRHQLDGFSLTNIRTSTGYRTLFSGRCRPLPPLHGRRHKAEHYSFRGPSPLFSAIAPAL